ncbi:hypothetical protein [Planococcus sp. NCCP-2050]|uniref:hypothetical protein n=1 Tax=Planococcus sp. NCCP-2050 TaxID=2944679 RepID=UPI00203E8EF3|nr:hypothetical protein [Planococcus sp. NCCP-2050]GKW46896.1 hypothetical protein NCCP2050_25880 [Planococcus sp. NCCP-2050]
MDCIICGEQVVNENNRLQKKVKDYLRTTSELDVKHRWIKQWKICYDCSESYKNDHLIGNSEVLQKIEEKKKRNKQLGKALRHKREQEPLGELRAYYIEKYIDYATCKAEKNGRNIVEPPHLRSNQQYDATYITYVKSSQSTAVLIVRNLVNDIDTKGKWIDVRHMEKRFLSHSDEDFSFIIVELFSRKQKPIYPKKTAEETNSDYKNRLAYITWQTATADIHHQRTQGIEGDVYIVLPCLKNEHESTYEKHYIVWDHSHRHFKRVRESNQYVNILKPPIWGYDIVATKKINHQQLRYIEKNLYQIISKTHKKSAVALSIFSPPKKKGTASKLKRELKGERKG